MSEVAARGFRHPLRVDKKIWLWDMGTGQLMQVLEGHTMLFAPKMTPALGD